MDTEFPKWADVEAVLDDAATAIQAQVGKAEKAEAELAEFREGIREIHESGDCGRMLSHLLTPKGE